MTERARRVFVGIKLLTASLFVFIGALAVIWTAFYPLESRCRCGYCLLNRLVMIEIGVSGLLLLVDELPGPRRLGHDEKVFAVTVLVAGVVTTFFCFLGVPLFLWGLWFLVPWGSEHYNSSLANTGKWSDG